MKIKGTHLIISSIISLFLLVVSYWGNNIRRPLLENYDLIRLIELITDGSLNKHNKVEPSNYLLINTAFDKSSIDKHENDEPGGRIIGKQFITDRRKLIDFLELAKQSDYRYLIIDLDFSKELMDGNNDSIDNKLVDLLLSMKKVFIPLPVDEDGNYKQLLDDRLNDIAYSAVLLGTWRIKSLTPLPLQHNGVKSIPLRVFEDSTKVLYQEHPLYSKLGRKLCYKKVFAFNYVKDKAVRDFNGYQHQSTLYTMLGADYLQANALKATAPKRLSKKIIIIGDYENDKVLSYYGTIAGSLVILNEFFSLMNEWNVVKWGFVVFCFFLFLFTFYAMMEGWSLIKMTKIKNHKLASLLSSFLSVTIIYNIIKVILFYCFHIYFCLFFPVLFISLLSPFISLKDEK